MAGLTLYALGLVALGLAGSALWWDARSAQVLVAIGAVAAWRYGWGATNLARALVYRHLVFPALRARARIAGPPAMPGTVFILITSYRIETETSLAVYRAAVSEAVACGARVHLVACIVEMADQRLVKQLFTALAPPDRVTLGFVRTPGTGKRDGVAQGLRAVVRAAPPPDAAVVLVDGDTLLTPGALGSALPFFSLLPGVDALTTDEACRVRGGRLFQDWYDVRFAQRHNQMSSVALSRRVLTLTGRMSAFRARVATSPEFIAAVEADFVDHWRLGHIKLLTGDDKSTWLHVLKSGREMLYVPDVQVLTLETQPRRSFVGSAGVLMQRWLGNMLRANGRALRLGPSPMGWFPWWCLLDQRISMWTTLLGPAAAIIAGFAYGPAPALFYGYWILLTRLIQTLTLLTARRRVSWTYPALLYFNQVFGALVKTWVLFRQDQQQWTRQPTVAHRNLDRLDAGALAASSWTMHIVALLALTSLVVVGLGLARLPTLLPLP